MLLRFVTVAVIVSTATVGIFSQQEVKLLAKGSTVTIKGTSSLHDWEEKVEKFDVQLVMRLGNTEITGIDQVNFVCQAASISSEYSIMTSKTHNALLVEKHPEIIFNMVSVEKLTSVNGKFSGIINGDLKLTGITKRVRVAFTGLIENDKIIISGAKDLNLNDYRIKPPTAMLGTLKTGEIITISFTLQFQAS